MTLLGALRPPRPSLPAAPPTGRAGESRADELAWRLVAQLSLNYLGLAVEGGAAEPLRATLELYADRGDPALARHARAIADVAARPVVERLPIAGPMCFGRGTEVTLEIDESVLAGHSALLLSALLARLFARYAAVNAFVRTRTRLLQSHEEVPWPIDARQPQPDLTGRRPAGAGDGLLRAPAPARSAAAAASAAAAGPTASRRGSARQLRLGFAVRDVAALPARPASARRRG